MHLKSSFTVSLKADKARKVNMRGDAVFLSADTLPTPSTIINARLLLLWLSCTYTARKSVEKESEVQKRHLISLIWKFLPSPLT